jgi:hypothetical protein
LLLKLIISLANPTLLIKSHPIKSQLSHHQITIRSQ